MQITMASAFLLPLLLLQHGSDYFNTQALYATNLNTVACKPKSTFRRPLISGGSLCF